MQIIDTVPGDGRSVSLTFDDGPSPANTPRLLSVLRTYGVRAVFCLVGQEALKHPELVRAIAADGHTLGNHSMRHDDMTNWTQPDIEADLRDTNAAIVGALPGAPIPYFRAPYGHWGDSPRVATGLGLSPLGWRLSVTDWEPPGTAELVRRLETGITPGAVVLLHDGGGDRSQTVDAVEQVVPALLAGGWRFALPG